MDARQLRTVLAVMTHGSLGKAAKALHISQPALSKTLQRLEQQLDAPLFSRDARGMHPTLYAECLRSYALTVSRGLDHARAEIEALKAGHKGVVTIGASPLTASRILPDAIARLTRERPGVFVRVVTTSADLVPGLLANDYDIVVKALTQDTPDRGIRQRILFSDRMIIVARRGHPLTRRKAIRAEDLQAYPWVLPRPGNLHRGCLERFFEAEGLRPPRVAVECSTTGVITGMVRRSDCLGVIAEIALDRRGGGRGAAEAALAALKIDSPFLTRSIGLLWREHDMLTPATQVMVSAIEAVCRTRRQPHKRRLSPANKIP